MRKIKIEVEEDLRFRKDIIVTVPDEISDDEFERMLGEVERQSESIIDIPYILTDISGDKINTIEMPRSDYSSPDDVDIEISEYEDL